MKIKSKNTLKILFFLVILLPFISVLFVSNSKNIFAENSKIKKVDTADIMRIIGYSPKFYSYKEAVILRKKVENLASNYQNRICIGGNTNKPKVALTFDDAPEKYTENIVRILNKYNIKGTFFCIGNQIEIYPDIIKMIDASGHILANHSFSHQKFTLTDQKTIFAEIAKTNELVFKYINKYPNFFRPPYGAVDQNVIDYVVDFNMTTIYWSLDLYDWLETKQYVIESIENNLRNDEILLLHSNKNTFENLPLIIETIQSKGFEIVPLEELVNQNAYQQIKEVDVSLF